VILTAVYLSYHCKNHCYYCCSSERDFYEEVVIQIRFVLLLMAMYYIQLNYFPCSQGNERTTCCRRRYFPYIQIAERRYNRNLSLSHLFFLRIIMPLSRLIRRNGRSMSRTIFIQCNRSFAMLSSRSGIVDRKPAIAFEHTWFNSTTKEVY
jgi:hypothetical protein